MLNGAVVDICMLIYNKDYGNTVPVRFEECSVRIPCLIVGGIGWLSAASAAHCPCPTLSRCASRSIPIF